MCGVLSRNVFFYFVFHIHSHNIKRGVLGGRGTGQEYAWLMLVRGGCLTEP